MQFTHHVMDPNFTIDLWPIESGFSTNPASFGVLRLQESALMSAVRRQMDAFEEKWEKKFRGDDHYWLTRPAHTVGAQGAHGDGRPGNTIQGSWR
jgi:hypothetical protein